MTGRDAGRRRDAGSATAELAVALPALTMILVMALGAIHALQTQLSCIAAARDAALAQARGDDPVAAASRSAPAGALVDVWIDGDTVKARVRVRTRPLGRGLPGLMIDERAQAAREPTGIATTGVAGATNASGGRR